MEDHYERKAGGYCGSGHAASGYEADGKRSDRYFCGGSGITDSFLRGTDGKGKYPAATAGRDRGGQTAGSTVWPPAERNTGRIFLFKEMLRRREDHFQRSGAQIGDLSGYVSALDTRSIIYKFENESQENVGNIDQLFYIISCGKTVPLFTDFPMLWIITRRNENVCSG